MEAKWLFCHLEHPQIQCLASSGKEEMSAKSHYHFNTSLRIRGTLEKSISKVVLHSTVSPYCGLSERQTSISTVKAIAPRITASSYYSPSVGNWST